MNLVIRKRKGVKLLIRKVNPKRIRSDVRYGDLVKKEKGWYIPIKDERYWGSMSVRGKRDELLEGMILDF